MGDAAGDIQPPEQAAAEALGQKLPVILKAHKLDGLFYQLLALPLVVDIQAAKIADILIHRQLVEYRHVLHYHADIPLQAVSVRPHWLAEQLDGAPVVF